MHIHRFGQYRVANRLYPLWMFQTQNLTAESAKKTLQSHWYCVHIYIMYI